MDDDNELIGLLDPDCIYRALALVCATLSDTTKDEQKILSRAMVFEEYIDPFGFDFEGECDKDDDGLPVTLKPVKPH